MLQVAQSVLEFVIFGSVEKRIAYDISVLLEKLAFLYENSLLIIPFCVAPAILSEK
jgi:hypothetical protein